MWYKVLNVDKNANAKDIRTSYKQLVLIHHPDKGGDLESFRSIQNAYEESIKYTSVKPFMSGLHDPSIAKMKNPFMNPLSRSSAKSFTAMMMEKHPENNPVLLTFLEMITKGGSIDGPTSIYYNMLKQKLFEKNMKKAKTKKQTPNQNSKDIYKILDILVEMRKNNVKFYNKVLIELIKNYVFVKTSKLRKAELITAIFDGIASDLIKEKAKEISIEFNGNETREEIISKFLYIPIYTL